MIKTNFYNRNMEYQQRVLNLIEQNKEQIFNFFEVDNLDLNFNLYIYDTIEDLVKGMNDRGFLSMPSYMCACFKDEDNSLNLFEPKDNPSSDEWSKVEYDNVIFHELVHAINYQIYGSQYEWITEGIATYLDGTYKKGKKWLIENYISKYPIPSIYELEHEFGHHEYDSYDYAYLMISYLIETLGKTKFLQVIKNINEVNEIKNNLIIDAINYYKEKE